MWPGAAADQEPIPGVPPPGAQVLSVTTSATNADVTNHSVAMPAIVNAGDGLLISFANDGNSTISTPAGWTLLDSSSNGTLVRGSWFWKIAAGTEGGTNVSFTLSAGQRAAAHVHRIKAGSFDPATPPELQRSYYLVTNTPSWGAGDTLWIASCAIRQDPSVTSWPLTDRQTLRASTGSGNCSLASCTQVMNLAEWPDPFADPMVELVTSPGSSQWDAVIAIKAAA